MVKWGGWAWLFAALCVAAPAEAQTISRPVTELLGAIEPRLDQMDAHSIALRIGGGPVVTSRVDAGGGSSVYGLPYLSFEYHGILAVDDTQARLSLVSPESSLGKSGFRAGPMLRIDPGRGNVSRPGIAGLGKVPVSLEAGGFVSYSFGPARLRLRLRQDVTHGHNGTVGELDLRSGLYKHGAFSLGAQVQTVWGSRNYNQTYYGISAWQAANTHLPMYSVGAGFKDMNFTLMGEYKFSRRWSAIGALQYVRLLDGAADSPITMTRGAANRVNVGMLVVYTFGGKPDQR